MRKDLPLLHGVAVAKVEQRNLHVTHATKRIRIKLYTSHDSRYNRSQPASDKAINYLRGERTNLREDRSTRNTGRDDILMTQLPG